MDPRKLSILPDLPRVAFTSKQVNLNNQKVSALYLDRSKHINYNAMYQGQYLDQKAQNVNYLHNTKMSCPSSKDILKINLNKLAKMGRSKYYDPHIIALEQCLVSAWVLGPAKPEYQDLKLFWDDLINISRGRYGRVATSSRANIKELFVIKYNYPPEDEDISREDLNVMDMHEMFVALVLNKYRKQIPNFMYGFGFFECNLPLETYRNGVESICNTKPNQPIHYLIFENIPGEELYQFLRGDDVSTAKILNYYTQILFSLEITKDINYSHNDLHDLNVILRPIDTKTSGLRTSERSTKGLRTSERGTKGLRYDVGARTWYLETDMVATIIDYGYSYIEHNHKKYSGKDLLVAGVYWDRSNRILDAYKLLMVIGHNLMTQSDPKKARILKDLTPLFRYFIDDSEDVSAYLKEHKKSQYTISPQKDYQHLDLILYIIKSYPKIMSTLLKTTAPTQVLGDAKEVMSQVLAYTPTDLFYLARDKGVSVTELKEFQKRKEQITPLIKRWKTQNSSLITRTDVLVQNLRPLRYSDPLKVDFISVAPKYKLEIESLLDLLARTMLLRDIIFYFFIYTQDLPADKPVILSLKKNTYFTFLANDRLVNLHKRSLPMEEVHFLQLGILTEERKDMSVSVKALNDILLILGRVRYITSLVPRVYTKGYIKIKTEL